MLTSKDLHIEQRAWELTQDPFVLEQEKVIYLHNIKQKKENVKSNESETQGFQSNQILREGNQR